MREAACLLSLLQQSHDNYLPRNVHLETSILKIGYPDRKVFPALFLVMSGYQDSGSAVYHALSVVSTSA
jgi:hypothetical protein